MNLAAAARGCGQKTRSKISPTPRGNRMLDAHQLLWTQIAAGVCLLISAAMLYNWFRLRAQMQAAHSWDKTEGVITLSRVEQPATHVSDDLNDASPVIHYRYRAGGQEFEGDRIGIGGQPMTTSVLAARRIAKYPVGARVDVYIDPNAPGNALLEPGQQGGLAAQLAITITFGIAAAVLVAHAIAGHVLYTGNGVPLFAFVLPMVALVAAVFSIVSFSRTRRLASASASWPTTSGIITTSGVIEEVIQDQGNSDKSRVRWIHRYQVDLRYAYQVANRDFVGTTANWGWTDVYGLRELAEKAASPYSPGQPVAVHYDPEQPGNAVLEPDNRQGSVAPLIFGAISAVAGSAMLAFFVKVGFGN
jgi:hypothetical protein